MAEGLGFEPWVPLDTPVFKTGAFDHSATPPVTFFNVASYSGNSEVHVRFIRNGSAPKSAADYTVDYPLFKGESTDISDVRRPGCRFGIGHPH